MSGDPSIVTINVRCVRFPTLRNEGFGGSPNRDMKARKRIASPTNTAMTVHSTTITASRHPRRR
jgi:hypothetical protein